jgi:hypothetical protein
MGEDDGELVFGDPGPGSNFQRESAWITRFPALYRARPEWVDATKTWGTKETGVQHIKRKAEELEYKVEVVTRKHRDGTRHVFLRCP